MTKKMKGVEIYNFIKPHLGEIEFTGSHEKDLERVENIGTYKDLIFCLLEDIVNAKYSTQDRFEESAKLINLKCEESIEAIKENIKEA